MKVKILNYILIVEKIEAEKNIFFNKGYANIFVNKEGTEVNEEYGVLDVAKLIINYAIQQQAPISNLQLQKILYYVQAAFLVENNAPCFREEIVNWRYGPVIREVYSEYRKYGAQSIKDLQRVSNSIIYDNIKNNINFVRQEFNPDNIFEQNHIELIEEITNSYLGFNAFELIKKTHREGPWLNSRQDEIIDKEDIREYYIQHTDMLRGMN